MKDEIGAPVQMSTEQLDTLKAGIIDAAAIKGVQLLATDETAMNALVAKAIDIIKRETADPLKGIINGEGVASPAFVIKSLPFNPYEAHTDNFKGLGIARLGRMKAAAALEQKSPDYIAEKFQKALGSAGAVITAAMKGMNEGNVADGGALLSTFYGEFIQLLREQAVVRGSGIRTLPMPGGSITMRKQTAAGVAHYVGEKPSGDKTSKQAYGLEQLGLCKIMAETVLSNDLIRDAGPDADVMTRDDLQMVAALREDLAFIRGDGTENTPKGIYFRTKAGNKFDANATVNLANVTADLGKARLKMRQSLLPLVNLRWLISPRTETYLRTLRDGNGNLVYKSEMDSGKLDGFPFYVTTQISETIDTNKTEIYLYSAPQLIVFDSMQFEIETYRGAAYLGPNGVEAGLSNDESVVQLIGRHNFFQRHDAAAVVIEAVSWGA